MRILIKKTKIPYRVMKMIISLEIVKIIVNKIYELSRKYCLKIKLKKK